jgi:hypothetical protein
VIAAINAQHLPRVKGLALQDDVGNQALKPIRVPSFSGNALNGEFGAAAVFRSRRQQGAIR